MNIELCDESYPCHKCGVMVDLENSMGSPFRSEIKRGGAWGLFYFCGPCYEELMKDDRLFIFRDRKIFVFVGEEEGFVELKDPYQELAILQMEQAEVSARTSQLLGAMQEWETGEKPPAPDPGEED